MPRFFVESKNIFDTYILICGNDARHIGRSLRMKVSDKITNARLIRFPTARLRHKSSLKIK